MKNSIQFLSKLSLTRTLVSALTFAVCLTLLGCSGGGTEGTRTKEAQIEFFQLDGVTAAAGVTITSFNADLPIADSTTDSDGRAVIQVAESNAKLSFSSAALGLVNETLEFGEVPNNVETLILRLKRSDNELQKIDVLDVQVVLTDSASDSDPASSDSAADSELGSQNGSGILAPPTTQSRVPKPKTTPTPSPTPPADGGGNEGGNGVSDNTGEGSPTFSSNLGNGPDAGSGGGSGSGAPPMSDTIGNNSSDTAGGGGGPPSVGTLSSGGTPSSDTAAPVGSNPSEISGPSNPRRP